jgi:hypothetical protein
MYTGFEIKLTDVQGHSLTVEVAKLAVAKVKVAWE